MSNVLEMRGISKYFPGVVANENVDFSLRKGEIHTLLGENGAGKSTLMNILCGLYHPDSGELFIDGEKVTIHAPKDAVRLGIGMVHQHFRLSEKHTAFENSIIGYDHVSFFPNKKKLYGEITQICDRYGLNLDLNRKIYELAINEQQKVEIIKTLVNQPKIMIFDEPTAVLSAQETDKLFTVLEILKQNGFSIIFISHKLDEVLRISDRITILAKGKLIDTIDAKMVTKEFLAEKMIGRKITFSVKKEQAGSDSELLTLKDAVAYNNKGLKAIDHLSLSIKKGEIFGIAGVSGNGQTELAEILFGLRQMECEEYLFNGESLIHPKPKRMMRLGMRLIPADRKLVGAAIGMNIPENFVLNRVRHAVFSHRFFLRTGNIHKKTKDTTERYAIKHHNFKNPVRDLSGGNLQKVIVAREIDSNPELLIAVYPTRGLDVGAIENLQKVLIEEQKKGKTILLISEELEELFALSDRIGVMYKGKIIKISDRAHADQNEIALAIGGVVK